MTILNLKLNHTVADVDLTNFDYMSDPYRNNLHKK